MGRRVAGGGGEALRRHGSTAHSSGGSGLRTSGASGVAALLCIVALALSAGCSDTAAEGVVTTGVGNNTIATNAVATNAVAGNGGGGGHTTGAGGYPPTTAGLTTSNDATVRHVVNLVFIHHSVGENWLNDGLCRELNEGRYHVADIYYGWREYGDRTDTTDWPMWFTDEVMDLVYQEMDAMTAANSVEPGEGENTIVMFKSCFPNSDVGSDTSDEMAIYNGLLPYFTQHPDKMFVLVTPPPMTGISHPLKTRELCDWLTDREAGWLSSLSTGNVFAFDLFTVLTHPDAHHRLVEGEEIHESIAGCDTLYYDSDGDDHPNYQGNLKATEEFVGLLDRWYEDFSAARE